MICTRGDVFGLTVVALFGPYSTPAPKLERLNIMGMGVILLAQISVGDPVCTYDPLLWTGFPYRVLCLLQVDPMWAIQVALEPLFYHL